jgi:hypothetical protein
MIEEPPSWTRWVEPTDWKARAEAAEEECGRAKDLLLVIQKRLEEQITRAEAAEKHEAALREALVAISNHGPAYPSTFTVSEMRDMARAALETKP